MAPTTALLFFACFMSTTTTTITTTTATTVATEMETGDRLSLQALMMLVKSQDSRLQQQASRLDLLQSMVTSLQASVNMRQARDHPHHHTQVKFTSDVLDAKLSAVVDNLTAVLTRAGWYDNSKADTSNAQVSEAEVKVISELLDVKLSGVVQNLTAVLSRDDTNKTAGGHGNTPPSTDHIGGIASTYIRWGRSVCPKGATIIYSGYGGGGGEVHTGTGSNRLCLSPEPVYGDMTMLSGGYGSVYGGQYHINHHTKFTDVLCSLCHTTFSATFMIPGTNRCPNGTTEQYHGFLSSGDNNSKSASEFLCLDSNPEDRHGSHADLRPSAWFEHVSTICGSLPCPPYRAGMPATCVVCSK